MIVFKTISAKRLIACTGILCAMLAVGGVLMQPVRTALTVSTQRDLPIYCVDSEKKVCSLTFDAAWGNEDTGQLIEILGEHNIQATFFVVGEWAEKYPESVKQLSDAGHEVMNHSSTHPHMPQLSAEQMISEVKQCNEKIKAITGKEPTLFRCPFGDYDDAVVGTMRSIGMYTIQWDVDSLDWKDPPASDIVKRVVEKAQPGSIILFHNAATNTPEALPAVIDGLIEKGFSFVPVSQLIMTENYKIDHTGKQIAADDAAQ